MLCFTPLEIRARAYFKEGPKKACWLWTGAINWCGYGYIGKRFRRGKHKNQSAHRVVFEMYKGKIPRGKVVRHTCDNPACVNPNHLLVGTTQDNKNDSVTRGRHAFGQRNGVAKLTDADVRAIRKDRRYQYVIAADYGVIQATISKIKLGNSWRHVK